VLVSALALAACGGSESPEDKITGVIEKSVTSTDPAVCTETQTTAFVEQTNSGNAKEALAKCEEDAEEAKNNPESIEVKEIEVEGEEATAKVSFTGGSFDGQTIAVALVQEEGDWKLNEAVEFVNLDREKLIAAFEKKLGEEAEIEPAVAECLIEGIEEASDSELEGFVFGEQEGLVGIAEECTK
jgi:ABC-type glycerol-3-phosphate transport system substrate-binding protein